MSKNDSGSSAVQQQQGTASSAVVPANLYDLAGHNLHVNYATSGFDGKPHLSYHDAHQTLNFTGDQIETVEARLGHIVSVVIRSSVDAGSTTFSLLVPRVNVTSGMQAPVQTQGITTIHKFSIVPALNRGQLDLYTVIPLHGTASQVFF